MDKWQFLDRWARILYPVARFDPGLRWQDQAKRGFSIAPHHCIRLDLSAVHEGSHEEITQALELVALAIRVDNRVWEKMRVMHLGTYAVFDWAQYRPEDLALRVEASFVGSEGGVQYFQSMSEDVSAYEDAKRRILALDVHGHLDGFQIPIRFAFQPRVEVAIAQLERMVTGGCMAWGPQARNSAPFLLEEVKIEPSRDPWVRFFEAFDEKVTPPSLRGLARLQDLGVAITSFHGTVEDDPAFLDWMATDRPLTLTLLAQDEEELRRAAETCSRLHDRLEALALCMTRYMDDTFLADVLFALSRSCLPLWYIEMDRRLSSDGWDTLGRAATRAAKNQPANPQSLISSARAFVMRLDNMTRHTACVINRLSEWLPCLQSLVLSRGKYKVVDDACFRLILQAFPLLVSLHVGRMKLTTWQDLLDAYETRDCRIRTLVVGTEGGMTCEPLVEALASPSMRMARTMKELQISTDCLDEVHRVVVAAMLEKNRFLEYFRLTHTRNENTEDEDRLRRFHRESLPKPDVDRTGFRLAFLSVVRRSPLMHRLDSGVVSLIFTMASERVLRLVEVTH